MINVNCANVLVAGLAGAHRSLNKLYVLPQIRLGKAGTCFALERYLPESTVPNVRSTMTTTLLSLRKFQ